MIQLAAFLGNPGAEYARNRHNAGRMLAEALPFYASLSWQKKFKGLYAAAEGLSEKTHFLMPGTYMNLSGESVQAAAAFFKIKPEAILVVHDDLEIPLGTISLKFSGGLGGHNGLRSIKACLDTADFWRLRIGIGRPDSQDRSGSNGDIAGWVLSDFSAAELEILAPALNAAALLLRQALAEDPQKLLPEWGKKKITTGETDERR